MKTSISYTKLPNSISSEIQGETVMVNIDLGKYFALNNVASAIWNLLETDRTEEEIVAAMLEQFDVNEQECREQVSHFLKELVHLNLIKEV
jgi:hypothetical protein